MIHFSDTLPTFDDIVEAFKYPLTRKSRVEVIPAIASLLEGREVLDIIQSSDLSQYLTKDFNSLDAGSILKIVTSEFSRDLKQSTDESHEEMLFGLQDVASRMADICARSFSIKEDPKEQTHGDVATPSHQEVPEDVSLQVRELTRETARVSSIEEPGDLKTIPYPARLQDVDLDTSLDTYISCLMPYDQGLSGGEVADWIEGRTPSGVSVGIIWNKPLPKDLLEELDILQSDIMSFGIKGSLVEKKLMSCLEDDGRSWMESFIGSLDQRLDHEDIVHLSLAMENVLHRLSPQASRFFREFGGAAQISPDDESFISASMKAFRSLESRLSGVSSGQAREWNIMGDPPETGSVTAEKCLERSFFLHVFADMPFSSAIREVFAGVRACEIHEIFSEDPNAISQHLKIEAFNEALLRDPIRLLDLDPEDHMEPSETSPSP